MAGGWAAGATRATVLAGGGGVQARYRGRRSRRETSGRFAAQALAATRIQAWARRWLARRRVICTFSH